MALSQCAYGCGYNFFDQVRFGFDFGNYFPCPKCGGVNFCYEYDYMFQWPDGYQAGVLYTCSTMIHNDKNASWDCDYVMVKEWEIDADGELYPLPRYIYFLRASEIKLIPDYETI